MMSYYEELLEDGVPESIPSNDFTFEDIFDEHIANNQKTWKQDRRLTVGASECFSCIRKNFFVKRGHLMDPPVEKDLFYNESWGAMERGNIIENNYIVPAVEEGLKRRGMELIMAGDGQDTLIDGIHSATLDGLIINAPRDLLSYYGIEDIGSNEVVLEMKSFDPRLTLQNEKSVHRGQTQMQMGMIRDNTEYKPNYAVLLYVNASWLDDIRVFIIEYDHNEYMIGRARNEKVFSAENAGELQAEGKLDGACDYCPFTTACSAASAKRVPKKRQPLRANQVAEQDTQLLGKLEQLVQEHDDWKDQEKEAKQKLENVREEIKQTLITHGQSRAVAPDGKTWKIAYTAQKGRKKLDQELMIKDGIDPEKYTVEGSPFEKLTVTTG